MQRKADLVIIANEPFPIGMAATNRIQSYAMEIAKSKNVYVLIPKPTERSQDKNNSDAIGKIENLRYEYTNGITVWPYQKNRFRKLIILIKGYLNLVLRLFQLMPKTVIVYSGNTFLREILLDMKYLIGFKFYVEENEFPKILKKKISTINRQWNLTQYSRADGMLVISNELKNYYSKIGAKNIFHLPMTVNIRRFDIIESKKKDYKYFVYIGGGGGIERDGVKNIINGFNYFSKKGYSNKLLLIGPFNKSSSIYKDVCSLISEYRLRDKILFKGSVPSHEIPRYLKDSEGIVMTPQKNFSSGGFPTKLGEFLASGKPVICTNVSEISTYLNNYNSYFIEPGNDLLIANAMESIVKNKRESIKIGLQGKRVAETKFNIKVYAEELMKFLYINN